MTTALVDRVRIAFTTDPFSASPSWTDVSTDVQLKSGITCTRGKGDRYGQIQPGTLSLTLDNPTGAYTPNYAAGSNYPNVVIGKRIQWHASIDNGVNWFPRFDGFIDTYQTSWNTENGSWASCVVQATDRTKFLGRQSFLDSLLKTIIVADGAVDYWPLTDPVGTLHPQNVTGTIVLTPSSTTDPAQIVTYGVDGLPYEGTTAVQTEQTQLRASGPTHVYSGAFTLLAFVKIPVPNPFASYTPILLFDPTQAWDIFLRIDATTGEAIFEIEDPNFTQLQTGTPASGSMIDGQWHAIGGTFDPAAVGGSMTLYIDGVNIGSITGLGPLGATYTLFSIAGNLNAATVQPLLVQAHTALFSVVYGQGVLGPAGLTGFTGDTSHVRANRIADFANINPTNVGTAGTQSMGPLTDVAGKSLDQLLQEVQATENGAIFFAVDGTLKTVSRRNFDNPAIAITLPTGSYEADLQHVTDDSQLVNNVAATGSSGNRQTAVNTALSYLGTVNVDVTLNTTSDPEALGYAQRRLIDGTPAPRFDTVSLDLISMIPVTTPYNGVTVITAFWNSDIGSVLQCTGLPTGSAPATSMTQQIQGYTETRTAESYGVKFNTTPTFMNVWILQDATYGVLDSTTVPAY